LAGKPIMPGRTEVTVISCFYLWRHCFYFDLSVLFQSNSSCSAYPRW